MQSLLVYLSKIISRFAQLGFLVVLLASFSVSAQAVTFNVPATDEDGNFTISWSGARTYAELYHQVNGTWASIHGGSGSGAYTYQVTGKLPGAHSYMLKDCLVTGGQGGTSTSCTETIKSVTVATPSLPVASTPSITPNGGSFVNSATVTLSTTTSGATIRYTTNNTAVTSTSPIYSNPFALTSSTTVRAKAFKSGMTDSAERSANFTLTAATPTISPNGGSHTGFVDVSLATATAGATIRYTTNNTAVSSSSPVYSTPVRLSSTSVVRAKAFKSGMTDSAERSASFVVVPAIAARPNISPNGGTHNDSVTVSLSTATSGGTIRYTLNNTGVTSSSPVYSGSLAITQNTVVRAKTFKAGMTESPEASASFALKKFDVAINGSGQVVISWSGARTYAEIEEQVNGGAWGSSVAGGSGSGNMSAALERSNGTYSYRLKDCLVTGGQGGTTTSCDYWTQIRTVTVSNPVVATPVLTPNGGSATGSVSVSLSTPTSGATIRYTTNGSAVTPTSPIYSAAFSLTSNATVRAKAFKAGMNESAEASASFSVAVAKPTITPNGGNHIGSANVTLSTATSGATIRYTTNNTAVTASSTAYSGALTFTANTTLRVKAFKAGMADSAESSASFTVEPAIAASPSISPNGGTHNDSVTVSLSTITSGGTIRYTLNNTGVTSSSPVYSGPLTITQNTIVRAKTFKTGVIESPEASASFIVKKFDVAINGGGQVVISWGGARTYAEIEEQVNGGAWGSSIAGGSGSGTMSSALERSNGTYSYRLKDCLVTGDQGGTTTSCDYWTQIRTVTVSNPVVATPVLTPNGGSATGSVSVSLSTPTSGATIRYTTNGSAVTPTSPIYSAALTLTTNTTVRAKAFKAGMSESAEASASFSVAVAKPTITPNGGNHIGSANVTLSTATSGATIRYTTNNTAVTASSTAYSGALTFTANTTLRVKAFKAGMADSAESSASFTVEPAIAASPSISPNGGTHNDSVTVSLSTATSGGTIRYTLNNTGVTSSSPVYSGPLAITQNTIVRAKTFKTGVTESPEASASFTVKKFDVAINGSGQVVISWSGARSYAEIEEQVNGGAWGSSVAGGSGSGAMSSPLERSNGTYSYRLKDCLVTGGQGGTTTSCDYWTQVRTVTVSNPVVATPVLTPNGGSAEGSLSVSLSTPTSGATIRYTTDGSAVTGTSPAYSAALTLTTNATVRAKAFKTGMSESAEASASFSVAVVKPTITPNGGNHIGSANVTLSTATSGATIRYTTNNTAVTASSAVYSGALTFTANTTLRAKAFKAGMADSAEQSADFTFSVAAPTISPNGGSHTSYADISLATTTSGATIRYTTNNTPVTASSPIYSGPFNILSSSTVRARAYKTGLSTSSESVAGFTIDVPVLSFNVPVSDDDGTFDISWEGARTYAELYEIVDGQRGPGIYGGSGSGSYSYTISGRPVGVYSFMLKECLVTGSQGGSSESCTTHIKDVLVRMHPVFPSPLQIIVTPNSQNNNFIVTWPQASGAEHYFVQFGSATPIKVFSPGYIYLNAIPGESYSIKVQACNVVGCSPFSAPYSYLMPVQSSSSNSSSSVSSSSSSAGQSASSVPGGNGDVVSLPPADSGSLVPVYSIGGSFRVSESGAATYSIPLQVPVGVAGVKPQLSLEYSSQGGNGLLGLGWSLGGTSSIIRCRQTLAQDGVSLPLTWSSDDRFCLGGQRLMLTSGVYGSPGSTYRTEIDSYIDVTAVGGSAGNPSSFEVIAKDGSTTLYGASADSKTNLSASTIAWAVSRFSDNLGNRIDYEYESRVIKTISYAYSQPESSVGSLARVEFIYDDERIDPIRAFLVGGGSLSTLKRLKKIESYQDNSFYRSYELRYDNGNLVDRISRLTSLEECFPGAQCAPKKEFTWGEKSYLFSNDVKLLDRLPNTNAIKKHLFFDFNGDGRKDLVWVRRSGSTQYVEYAQVNESGMQKLTFSNSTPSISYSNVSSTDENSLKVEVIDYNADGRQDLLVCKPSSTQTSNCESWDLYLSMPTSDGGWILSSNPIEMPFVSRHMKFGDFTSNGLMDAYRVGTQGVSVYKLQPSGASDSSSTYYHYQSVPSTINIDQSTAPDARTLVFNPSRFVLGDFNGDGKVDIASYSETSACTSPTGCPPSNIFQGFQIFLNNGDSFGYSSELSFNYAEVAPTFSQHCSPCYDKVIPTNLIAADFNGDGMSDFTYSVGANRRFYLNAGNAFVELNNRVTTQPPILLDYNRDGFLDIVWHDTTAERIKYTLWSPSLGNFGGSGTSLYHERPNTKSYTLGDMTGDGFVDLIEFSVGADAGLDIGIYKSTANEDDLDFIQRIDDGAGRITEIKYGSLANSSHYTSIEGINTVEVPNDYPCDEDTYYSGSSYYCYPQAIYALDQSAFYSQLNSLYENGLPVLELSGPTYVVVQTGSSAPLPDDPENLGLITYHYHQARIQAGGRGFLGFEKLSTKDIQTGVRTETSYHQTWPLIGMPRETVVYTPQSSHTAEIKLSTATSVWDYTTFETEDLKTRYQTCLESSTEVSYDLTSNGSVQGAELQRTETVNECDDHGNLLSVSSVISGGGNTASSETINEYGTTDEDARFGRLSEVSVTTSQNGGTPTVRESAFEYYPLGSEWPRMLQKEIVEPNDPALKITKSYTYDLVGNKTHTTVEAMGSSGEVETRTNRVEYDSTNRFVQAAYNALDHETSYVLGRNGDGQPTFVRDANEHITSILYDAVGRAYQQTDPTGAWSHTARAFCNGTISCPSGAHYRVQHRVSGGGLVIEYLDVLGRTIRKSTVGFDGRESFVDTEFDSSGRVKRQSTPYFGGGTPAGWTVSDYDILGRVVKITAPDLTYTDIAYSGYVTTTTNALEQIRTETRNGLNQLVSVEDNLGGTIVYEYDSYANLLSATTSADGETVKVRMCYDQLGRKVAMHDPDKGGFLGNESASCDTVASSTTLNGWWRYTYNGFSELINQTDTKKQTVSTTYDTLGRTLTRTDKLQSGDVESHTRWFYDSHIGDDSQPVRLRGKLTGVVMSYGGVSESCSGANHCTTYEYSDEGQPTDTVIYHPDSDIGYITTVEYDTIGRVFRQRDALSTLSFADGSGTYTHYNSYGYPEYTQDLLSGDILQKTLETNARGQVISEERNSGSNGMTTHTYYYNDYTGLLEEQRGLKAGLFHLQDNAYDWDEVGNLNYRHNRSVNVAGTASKNLQESFCYDGLNRLIKSHLNTLSGSCSLSGAQQDVEYDGLGNITRKNGVGDYAYGTNAGPHAVTSTTAGGAYTYDNNGNQITGAQRTLSYTTADQLKHAEKGGVTTEFVYGPDRSRWQRKDEKNSQITVTTYIGSVERIEVVGSNIVEWKRYLGGAIYTYRTTKSGSNYALASNGLNKSFIFNDHLGSLDVVTNQHGQVTHSASFDAWGKRRNPETWAAGDFPASPSLLMVGFTQPLTNRGYTGHEMLDDMGLIHMNGRVYDATLGRFLQADPFIQAAANTQSYNRYSYLWNNPLNATDPSGFFLKKLWDEIRPYVAAIVGIVVNYYFPGLGPIVSGMIGGVAGAAANGGNLLEGMVMGAFNGVIGILGAQGHFFVAGFAGGAQSLLMGGKFGHGFISAGVGGSAGRAGGWTGLVASMVVSGTVTEMSGGKFKNGAAGAAFMYAVTVGVSKIEVGGSDDGTVVVGAENGAKKEDLTPVQPEFYGSDGSPLDVHDSLESALQAGEDASRAAYAAGGVDVEYGVLTIKGHVTEDGLQTYYNSKVGTSNHSHGIRWISTGLQNSLVAVSHSHPNDLGFSPGDKDTYKALVKGGYNEFRGVYMFDGKGNHWYGPRSPGFFRGTRTHSCGGSGASSWVCPTPGADWKRGF